MATHKSAMKRARQNENRRLRNKAVRTRVKGAVKAVRSALTAGNKEEAVKALAAAEPILDKAASKGAIHHGTASRKISRLAKQVHKL